MPAALHILRIKVGGWKAIREDNPVEINFQGGKKFASSALIVGPNESGKSSLFSALRFALFEKFNRRGGATKNWVNHDSNEARIEVDLLINGENYSIIKTRKYTSGGTSKLEFGTGADKEVLVRGQDADSKILELLGASWKGSKTVEEMPSNWGLLAWLLAPQGMDSVNPARESGTETLGLNRVMSPELSTLQETLKKANASELNDNMTPKKGGKYWEADQEEKNLRSDITELTNKSEAFSDLMENIQKCNTKIEDLNRKEEEAQNEYDTVLGDHSDSEPLLETNLESLKSKAEAQELKKIELLNELETLTDLEAELSEARIDLTKSIESESSLRSELDRVLIEQKMQDTKEKNDEIALEELRKQHRKSAEEVDKIEQQRNRKKLVDELTKVEEQMQNHENLLKVGPVLDLSELQEIKSLIDQYKNIQQRIDAKKDVSGLTVESEGKFDGTIFVDGEEHSSFDSPKPFGISLGIHTKKGQSITVKSITEDDDEGILEERSRLKSQFGQYDSEDFKSLEEKYKLEYTRYNNSERILRDLSLWKSKEDLEKEISQIPLIEYSEAELNDIEIRINERDEMQEKLDNDSDSLKQLRSANEKGRKAIGVVVRKKHEESLMQRTKCEAIAQAKDKQVRDEINRKGDLKQRKARLKDSEIDLKKTVKELEIATTSIDQKRKSRKSNVKRAKKNLNRAKSDSADIKEELTRLKFEAEQIGNQNIHDDLHDSLTHHQDVLKRLTRLKRQVHARDRLANRIKVKISESTSIETKPIRDKVSEWLYAVTDGKWRRVTMDGNLEIKEIHGPQGKMLPGEDYGSHGLQQVIHALIRLAVATHIYEKGKKENPDFPPVSLVMDESQGHVDDDRVRLLVERFNTAIKDGEVQVIALSHRETEFRSLSPVIEYRVDKRRLIEEEE